MNKQKLDPWLLELDSNPEMVVLFVIVGLSLLLLFNELLR